MLSSKLNWKAATRTQVESGNRPGNVSNLHRIAGSLFINYKIENRDPDTNFDQFCKRHIIDPC